MANTPLMPKATAVWLVDNTSLTFDQIADFCGLHALEIKGIADGEVSGGIKGMDPIASGKLTRKEIDKGQEKPSHRLKLLESTVKEVNQIGKKKRRGPRYTPVSRRQDRPNAILWLLQYHPELTENEIVRLLGTTKNTIQTIGAGKHWNSKALEPIDPVTLALCTQMNLDKAVAKAGERLKAERKEAGLDPDAPIETLRPISETVKDDVINPAHLADSWMKDNATPAVAKEKEMTAEDVFGSSDDDDDVNKKAQSSDKAEKQAEVDAALSAFDKLDDKDSGEAKPVIKLELNAKENKPKEKAEVEAEDKTAAASEETDTAEKAEEKPSEEAADSADKNAAYHASTEAVFPDHNPVVVDGIVKYLGIALRSSKDAATVACSDKAELDNIKAKFLTKKLGLTLSEEEQEAACQEVCEKMGKSNRSKCRVAFYYLLADKFDKLADFGAVEEKATEAMSLVSGGEGDDTVAGGAAADTFEGKNAAYYTSTEAVFPSHNSEVVDGIVKYLGIALRSSKDAATVACSDKTELDNIKAKFLTKKLGLTISEEEQEAACQEVCEKMGKSNRSKCRVAFYYLLADKFDKLGDFQK